MEYKVVTWTENGFSEGEEETDFTDDLGIALSWLMRDDCRYGTIYYNREVVATKDDWNYPIEYHNGWTSVGKRGE